MPAITTVADAQVAGKFDAANGTGSYKALSTTPPANSSPVGPYSSVKGAPQPETSGKTFAGTNTSGNTVFTDANIRENVIPALQAQGTKIATPNATPASQLTPGGTFIDTQGNTQTAKYDPATGQPYGGVDSNTNIDDSYEDIYKKTFDTLDQQPVDSSSQAELDTIKSSMANVDADTSAMVNSITSNYQGLQSALKQSQNGETAKIESALNLAGSSRYAPVSSSGIISAKNTYDIGQLSDLQTKENTAKQAAISAGQDKDYQLMESKLKVYNDIRDSKSALATKISDSIAAQTKKIRDDNIQSSRDLAISGLLQQGVTDPNQILNVLNYDENGNTIGDFTAKDVSDTVKSLSPTGDLTGLTGEVKNFYTLDQRGMLPDSIKNLPQGQQLFAYLKQEKAAATIAKTASTKTPTGRTPAATDIQQGATLLESNKGSDGYVDPYVYKQMYSTWVNAGYDAASFIKAYPPKNYVNPAETILPSYLAPPKAKSTSNSSASQAP